MLTESNMYDSKIIESYDEPKRDTSITISEGTRKKIEKLAEERQLPMKYYLQELITNEFVKRLEILKNKGLVGVNR